MCSSCSSLNCISKNCTTVLEGSSNQPYGSNTDSEISIVKIQSNVNNITKQNENVLDVTDPINQFKTINSSNKSPKSHSKNANLIENEFNFKHRGLHIVNLNIRHLKPKIDDMKVMLSQENCIDVFGVNETFLNTTVDDNFLNINGFAFVRKDS